MSLSRSSDSLNSFAIKKPQQATYSISYRKELKIATAGLFSTSLTDCNSSTLCFCDGDRAH